MLFLERYLQGLVPQGWINILTPTTHTIVQNDAVHVDSVTLKQYASFVINNGNENRLALLPFTELGKLDGDVININVPNGTQFIYGAVRNGFFFAVGIQTINANATRIVVTKVNIALQSIVTTKVFAQGNDTTLAYAISPNAKGFTLDINGNLYICAGYIIRNNGVAFAQGSVIIKLDSDLNTLFAANYSAPNFGQPNQVNYNFTSPVVRVNGKSLYALSGGTGTIGEYGFLELNSDGTFSQAQSGSLGNESGGAFHANLDAAENLYLSGLGTNRYISAKFNNLNVLQLAKIYSNGTWIALEPIANGDLLAHDTGGIKTLSNVFGNKVARSITGPNFQQAFTYRPKRDGSYFSSGLITTSSIIRLTLFSQFIDGNYLGTFQNLTFAAGVTPVEIGNFALGSASISITPTGFSNTANPALSVGTTDFQESYSRIPS